MSADELEWIAPDEHASIAAVRETLAAELAAAPPDLAHDAQVLRFLRGHGGEPAKAAKVMRAALEYRMGLASREPFASVRAACADDTTLDFSRLPHHERVLKFLPLRPIEGVSCQGLPVAATVSRLNDFDAFTAMVEQDEAAVDEFIRAMLEQRAVVIHNRSVKEQRLVKVFELRDLTGISVTEMLTRGRGPLSKLRSFVAVVQDFYPELVHRVLIFNTPSTFSQLFALVSPLLNARMQAKIAFRALGDGFAPLADELPAATLHSWLRQATAHLELTNVIVQNGSHEYIVRWLDEGGALRWRVELLEGSELKLRAVWFPAAGGGAAAVVEDAAVVAGVGAPAEGRHQATGGAGLWLLCLDNYAAWWYGVRAAIEIAAE